jgi:hypothetical protein
MLAAERGCTIQEIITHLIKEEIKEWKSDYHITQNSPDGSRKT